MCEGVPLGRLGDSLRCRLEGGGPNSPSFGVSSPFCSIVFLNSFSSILASRPDSLSLASLPPFPKVSAPKKISIKIDISAKKRKKNLPSRAESRNHVLECPPVGGHGSTRRCVPDIQPQAERGSSGRGLEERPGARRGTRFRHFREREERLERD